MRFSVLSIALSAIAIVFAVTANAADPPDDRVAALITRLASASRAERVEAERELAEGELAVLQHLPDRAEISDPAVGLAVDRIRARLLERRALQDASPTMIDGEGVATLGDLANASRSQIAVTKEIASNKIDLPDEQLTLWEAVDHAAAQLELQPIVSQKIRLREPMTDDLERSIAHSGAFRFVASPIRLRPISGDANKRLARLTLEVQAEPKLRPLFLSYAGDEMSLSTDGSVLAPFSPNARVELPLGERERSVSFPLDFVAHGDPSAPFDLTGRVMATVAAGKERFSFPLDGFNAKQSQAGVTVELHRFEKTDDGGAIAELSVVYQGGGPAFESHRTWVYHNRADLTFKSSNFGKRMEHEPGFSTLAISSGGVKLGYRFAKLPPDAKEIVFNYEAPTKIVEVPVAFEMKGLQFARPFNAGSAAGP